MIDLEDYKTQPEEYEEMERDRIIEIINNMKKKTGTEGNGRSMYPLWQDESYKDAVDSFIFDLKKKLDSQNTGKVSE